MWCSACCLHAFKLEFAPRLLIVQNGTTNSAHELVDKLNKADLPSSVGKGPRASRIPLTCCTLDKTLYGRIVLQRLWWLLLSFISHWCNLTFVGRLPCQPRTVGSKAMVPTQERSGKPLQNFPMTISESQCAHCAAQYNIPYLWCSAMRSLELWPSLAAQYGLTIQLKHQCLDTLLDPDMHALCL